MTDFGILSSPEFSAALTETLVESDAMALLVFGPDLKLVGANRLAGIALGKGALPAGTDLSEVLAEPDVRRLRDAVSGDATPGDPLLLRAAEAPGDPDRSILGSIVEVPGSTGDPARYVVIGRSAAPDLRREARILRAQRYEIVGQLASGVAHDLNNRLSTVTTFSDLMLGDADPESQDAEDLAEIKGAGLEAATITRKLDMFAGGHTGGAMESSIPDVVRGFEKLVRRFLGNTITLVTELDDTCPSVGTPPIRIEEVLIALVSNARDTMPDGGTLTIRAMRDARTPATTILEVQDTGSGDVRAPIEQALEPFFSTKSPSLGSGLGLATVHGILDALGGRIEMERATDGSGTIVRITLPAGDAGEANTDDAEHEPGGGSVDRLRVGLIEPDVQARGALARGLSRAGIEVSGFSSTAEIASSGATFDAVVADVPDHPGAGQAIVEVLRDRKEGEPVVLLRRRASPQAFAPGTPNVLEVAKPVDLAAVRNAIQTVTRGNPRTGIRM
ncbi:MAG: ATP-binding protein [Gemmatimonadota bacterium]